MFIFFFDNKKTKNPPKVAPYYQHMGVLPVTEIV